MSRVLLITQLCCGHECEMPRHWYIIRGQHSKIMSIIQMLESNDKTYWRQFFWLTWWSGLHSRGTDLGCKMLGNALTSPDLAKVLTLGSENTVTAQLSPCAVRTWEAAEVMSTKHPPSLASPEVLCLICYYSCVQRILSYVSNTSRRPSQWQRKKLEKWWKTEVPNNARLYSQCPVFLSQGLFFVNTRKMMGILHGMIWKIEGKQRPTFNNDDALKP